ncbi:MAG: hypothetical protein Q8R18_02420 [bacterium]|nr:hypothetical protein [bacterium]
MEEIKICTKCKEKKNLNDFYGKENKKMSWCKKCSSTQIMEGRKKNSLRWKEYYKDTRTRPSLIFSRKRANAKQQKVEFTISKEDFIEWYKKQELKCHYCLLQPKNFPQTNDPFLLTKVNLGLDRINCKEGYTLSNIVLCCNRCNIIKEDFFSYEEMKIIGRVVRKRWRKMGVKVLPKEV